MYFEFLTSEFAYNLSFAFIYFSASVPTVFFVSVQLLYFCIFIEANTKSKVHPVDLWGGILTSGSPWLLQPT